MNATHGISPKEARRLLSEDRLFRARMWWGGPRLLLSRDDGREHYRDQNSRLIVTPHGLFSVGQLRTGVL